MDAAQQKYVLSTSTEADHDELLDKWSKLELVLASLGGYEWLDVDAGEPATFIKRSPSGNIWVGVHANAVTYYSIELGTRTDDRPIVLHVFDEWSLERTLAALESHLLGG